MLMFFCLICFEYYLPISNNPFRKVNGGNSQSNIIFSIKCIYIWNEIKWNKMKKHNHKNISNHQLTRISGSCEDCLKKKKKTNKKKKEKNETIQRIKKQFSTWHEHTFVLSICIHACVLKSSQIQIQFKSNRIFDKAPYGLPISTFCSVYIAIWCFTLCVLLFVLIS